VLIVVDAHVVQPAPEQVKQLAAHGAATLQSFETAEHLRQLAYTDALTGVGSVTSFATRHRAPDRRPAGDAGPPSVEDWLPSLRVGRAVHVPGVILADLDAFKGGQRQPRSRRR
jgi:hypothetical protein